MSLNQIFDRIEPKWKTFKITRNYLLFHLYNIIKYLKIHTTINLNGEVFNIYGFKSHT